MEKQPPLDPLDTLSQKWLNFAREIWNDHDFWIKALAVKGGAGAIVIAGIMAIAHLVALPFLVAAVGIALCVGVVAVGLYSVFLSALTIWNKLVEVYYRTFLNKSFKRENTPRKLLSRRLAESPFMKALLEKALVQKLLKSSAWEATRRITKRQEDIFLAGLAMKGSIVSTIVGVSLIVTQILVLPVIAVGSLLTFTTLLAVSTIASGAYGIYLSTRGLIDAIRSKNKH